MLLSAKTGKTLADIPNDAERVTMGVRVSSSHLHLGRYLTLFNVVRLLRERPNMQGRIYIDDREFHFSTNRDAKNKPLTKPYDHSITAVQQKVTEFFAAMEKELPCDGLTKRVGIHRMSQAMCVKIPQTNENIGGRLYQQLVASRDSLQQNFPEFFKNFGDHQTEVMRPLCPHCETASPGSQNLRVTSDGMNDVCANVECKEFGSRYSVSPHTQPTDAWLIHYFIDPLRDRIVQRSSQSGMVHIFGGDYDAPWGMDKSVSLAQKQYRVVNSVDGPPLHYFVGPILNINGEKVGSSRGHQSPVPPASLLDEMTAENSPVIAVEKFPQAVSMLRQQTDSNLREFRRRP